MNSDGRVLAIDLGTQYLRAGFCGDDQPEVVLFNGTVNEQTPCWQYNASTMSRETSSKWWADILPNAQSMAHGIADGQTSGGGEMNEGVMQQVLETTFQKTNVSNDLSQVPVLFGISNANVALMPGLSELMFELLEADFMSCSSQIEALRDSFGRRRVSMLNLGAGSVEAGAMVGYDERGGPQEYCSVMGTRHYSSMFLEALKRDKPELRHLDMHNPIHLQCIDGWRSALQNKTNESNDFTLPDGSIVTFDPENSVDAELLELPLNLLFENDIVQNYLTGTEDNGMPNTVTDTIHRASQSLNVDNRKYRPEYICYGDVSKDLCNQIATRVTPQRVITVNNFADMFIAPFIGLSILGSLSTFSSRYYTKQTYLEFGPYQPSSKILHDNLYHYH